MCRHILNAKAFIQAGCCHNWYECSECHDELNDHPFKLTEPLRLTCIVCRRAFQIDLRVMMEQDKFCEQCQSKWCIEGAQFCADGITPESKLYEESTKYLDARLTLALDAKAIVK